MNELVEIKLKISKAALERAKEVIEEAGDEFGPGGCSFPSSSEWVEFQCAFEDATKDT